MSAKMAWGGNGEVLPNVVPPALPAPAAVDFLDQVGMEYTSTPIAK